VSAEFYRSARLRVRYKETDQMGVVHHANYLSWFEMGRTELIREAGLSYRQLEERGILLPLTDTSLSFKYPARYDDEIEVRTWVEEISPVRIVFAYEIRRAADEQLLVTGKTHHAFTTPDFRPVRVNRLQPEVFEWLKEEHLRAFPPVM